MLLDDDVLGIVQPVHLHVAFGLPGTGYTANGRLCLVQSRHIGKGGSGLFELALLELRLTHQQPGVPQEGVILPAVQPLNVLGGFAAPFVPLRTAFDAFQLDDLLRLLDSTVIVGLS